MDILDSLRQAPSAELYRLYVAIGKMLDDPRRIVEVRQRLRIGMTVRYVGDNPGGPLLEGTVAELRHTQAVAGQPEPAPMGGALRGNHPRCDGGPDAERSATAAPASR